MKKISFETPKNVVSINDINPISDNLFIAFGFKPFNKPPMSKGFVMKDFYGSTSRYKLPCFTDKFLEGNTYGSDYSWNEVCVTLKQADEVYLFDTQNEMFAWLMKKD